ncbi:glutathione S-transferase family protein [Vibrio sp.]|uniref:Glutathione S-transferase family protein n=1 Tax=Vibrio viridaestus TaxID=2487322 RepID=A0A3N9TL92_9VIBR|nr:glutathione S-transferase family protein [Vibrio viridaestus]MDC0609416.1 glutathione S-transferase family protein [Vibrio sp.]RQW64754.1 glutathione S-transferase family protein [Vibrio viridaestus]
MLVNGVWTEDWQPVQDKDEKGRFVRQTSSFRNWITADGSAGPTGVGGFKAEKDRYHLYVAFICPWASRTLMARALKGLTDYITVTVVNPKLSDQGWQFGGYPGADEDTLNGFAYMHQLYSHADSNFTGRATVPVLWDKKQGVVVSNESADIVKMLNNAFDHLTGSTLNLRPEELLSDIDAWNEDIYNNFNNGVYKAGFATTQFAYEEAYQNVFRTMDKLENQLSDGRQYLFGNALTETDVRTFVTLVRFDVAYYGLFKCNRNLVAQMPHLSKYMQRIFEIEGIKETVNIDHIKQGYYSIKSLNPTGIVPVGPETTL